MNFPQTEENFNKRKIKGTILTVETTRKFFVVGLLYELLFLIRVNGFVRKEGDSVSFRVPFILLSLGRRHYKNIDVGHPLVVKRLYKNFIDI